MRESLLREIPKVDRLLARPALAALSDSLGRTPVLAAARAVLDELRDALLSGAQKALPEEAAIEALILKRAERAALPSLTRAINLTGVALHTNLGRAPLAIQAVRQAADVARGYSTLEFDVEHGGRGSRNSHAARLLSEITGAEAAIVVNNNAAAVLLMLTALAAGREIIVSRGELVEIGGSFRIPEIMALSGAQLREVGTTNRTHLRDYEQAIGENTAALFKAHMSNYRIVGFSAEVPLESLVAIGRAHGLPVLFDLGGGLLRPLPNGLIADEPCVANALEAGADIVCFSGDKLLGGPQAGILAGSAALVARCAAHPLARALRADKMTLAALEATLRLYGDDALAQREIPVLRMLTASPDALREKAQRLSEALSFMADQVTLVEGEGRVGGGTAPESPLPSILLSITPRAVSVFRLEALLRGYRVPIICRIAQDALLLDVRTAEEADFPLIAEALQWSLQEGGR